jgi:hypothetical protein
VQVGVVADDVEYVQLAGPAIGVRGEVEIRRGDSELCGRGCAAA